MSEHVDGIPDVSSFWLHAFVTTGWSGVGEGSCMICSRRWAPSCHYPKARCWVEPWCTVVWALMWRHHVDEVTGRDHIVVSLAGLARLACCAREGWWGFGIVVAWSCTEDIGIAVMVEGVSGVE